MILGTIFLVWFVGAFSYKIANLKPYDDFPDITNYHYIKNKKQKNK